MNVDISACLAQRVGVHVFFIGQEPFVQTWLCEITEQAGKLPRHTMRQKEASAILNNLKEIVCHAYTNGTDRYSWFSPLITVCLLLICWLQNKYTCTSIITFIVRCDFLTNKITAIETDVQQCQLDMVLES